MAEPALLSPAELDALGRLLVRLRRRVGAGRAGPHRARGHGSSLDFDDYRPYQPGDDPRRVDRHAHRRLGRLLVKVYEAEEDAGIQVVLDASWSMAFGAKPRAACRLAAAMAVVAAHAGDRVRLVVADHEVAVGPWRRGRRAVPAVLADLEAVGRQLAARPTPSPPLPEGDADPLLAAVRRVLPQSRRGPVVLISDLLQPGHTAVVRSLAAARAGAAVIHVLGDEDLDPWLDDDPRLVDADYGTVVEGAATPAARQRFEARRDAWLEEVLADAGAARATYVRQVGAIDTARLLALLPGSGVVG